jgi:signal transduction histidine kinase
MFKTINSKFIVFTIIFILLSLGTPTVFLLIQFRENFKQRSVMLLDVTLDIFYTGLNHSMMQSHDKDVQQIVEQISSSNIIDHIRVFNEQGVILYSSDTSEVGKNMQRTAPHHLKGSLDKRRIFLMEDRKIYSTTLPIENKPACQKCHDEMPNIAYLDLDTDFTRAEINFYTGSIHIIFLAIAAIIVLFFGFYFLFNHFINKRLVNFITALDGVEGGNLSVHIPIKKEDEFGILEGHFNRMVENLRQSNDKIDELHSEQLQRADKLVTLGELAAEMAHEINNPAGIIMSRADYLQMESQNNKEIQKYTEDLNVILDQTEKISKITGNILKYGRKLPREFGSFDLLQSVENCLNMLEPRLKKKEIKLIKHFDQNICNLIGDPQQIEQVLINLINNAIDAMQEFGELTVLIGKKSANDCQLVVKDTGTGIDEHSLKHIFSPFYTTKSPEHGTGLGLYIVRNICNNHGAAINCQSSAKEGTTFTITFHNDSIST